MRSPALMFALLLGGPLLSCVPQPKRAYTLDQIPQIDSLEEIMKVQANTMDPLFAKRRHASFSPEEFATMTEAGRRIQTTSFTVRDRFATNRKPSFTTFATQLNGQAGELIAAAEAKDVAKAQLALSAMKGTCSGCHKENR